VNLEGVGSGSGLLDLTRESDDTSLGAELLDEIAPSPARRSAISDSGVSSGLGSGLGEPRGGVSRGGPVYKEAPDPMAPAFGVMSAFAAIVLIFSAFVLTSGIVGTKPDILNTFSSKGFLLLAGGSLIVPGIGFVIGLLLGKIGG
jgi:hypothetical protein